MRIETKHDELTRSHGVQVRPLANFPSETWVLVNCTICDQIVYGTRELHDQLEVVFNGQLVVSPDPRCIRIEHSLGFSLQTPVEAVNTMQMDEHYSKIFKVVIRPPSSAIFSALLSSSPNMGKVPDLLNCGDPKCKNLLALLNERLRKETERTEENIRQYTADQFVSMRVFRQAAEMEYLLLAQRLRAEPPTELLLNSAINKKLGSVSVVGGGLLETPPLTPDSGHGMSDSPPRLSHRTGARAPVSGVPAPEKRALSEEEEDFFGVGVYFPADCIASCEYALDDWGSGKETRGESFSGSRRQLMNRTPYPSFVAEPQEEGSEALQEGRYIPHTRRYANEQFEEGGMVVAKSLPIPTPAMQERIAQEDDQGDDDNDVDIAASIQALAKSVHGSDSIFGDLPRPRTQI